MAIVYLFADESGNLDFSGGGSRYFILTTVTLPDFSLGDRLLNLRREMGWRGIEIFDAFHASTDKQAVRNEVFHLIQQHEFRIDATLLNKSRAFPDIKDDEIRFYKVAWRIHFNYVAKRVMTDGDAIHVVAASLGTQKRKHLFHQAVRDVVEERGQAPNFRTSSWSAACEPCLQIADYCSWAIQRKWESGDDRSHKLIENKIASEFFAFDWGI